MRNENDDVGTKVALFAEIVQRVNEIIELVGEGQGRVKENASKVLDLLEELQGARCE